MHIFVPHSQVCRSWVSATTAKGREVDWEDKKKEWNRGNLLQSASLQCVWAFIIKMPDTKYACRFISLIILWGQLDSPHSWCTHQQIFGKYSGSEKLCSRPRGYKDFIPKKVIIIFPCRTHPLGSCRNNGGEARILDCARRQTRTGEGVTDFWSQVWMLSWP